MNRVPKREEERNQELIKDYQSGVSMLKLNIKYKISSARIYQILNFYNIPRNSDESKD